MKPGAWYTYPRRNEIISYPFLTERPPSLSRKERRNMSSGLFKVRILRIGFRANDITDLTPGFSE